MKYISLAIFIALALVFFSCKKDNYPPPSSTLSGKIVYKGEALNVQQDQVWFELWQEGFGKRGSFNFPIRQDGVFSAILFDGEYKLVIPNHEGPFLFKSLPNGQPDTTLLQVSGNKTMDIEVTPFYIIRNPKMSVSGKTVNTTFGLEKIITDANAKDVDFVVLAINKTSFVSDHGEENIARTVKVAADIANMGNIQLSVNIPDIVPAQNYVFARIGVRIRDREDMLYSAIQKLAF